MAKENSLLFLRLHLRYLSRLALEFIQSQSLAHRARALRRRRRSSPVVAVACALVIEPRSVVNALVIVPRGVVAAVGAAAVGGAAAVEHAEVMRGARELL